MAAGPHIVITGLMGVGKSTLARELGAVTGRSVRDSDADIAVLLGTDGATIAADHGVATLHGLEAAVLLGALADERPGIIAAAASVVEDRWCRQALGRRAFVVVLEAELGEVRARIDTGDHRRAMTGAELAELATRRKPHFAAVSDLTLDAEQPPPDLAATVLAATAP